MTVCIHFIWFDLFVKIQFPIPNIVAVYSLLVWLSPTSVMYVLGARNIRFLLFIPITNW